MDIAWSLGHLVDQRSEFAIHLMTTVVSQFHFDYFGWTSQSMKIFLVE